MENVFLLIKFQDESKFFPPFYVQKKSCLEIKFRVSTEFPSHMF